MTEWKLPEEYIFDNRSVRYGIIGDGPPVVVVHGTPWSSFNLRHLIHALSKAFTVYYYNRIVLIDPVAVAPWGSPFFQHVRKHESAFAGVPDYIHEAIVRAYVKTAAFESIEGAALDRIVLPWIEPGGKAAFYRQIAQADQRYTDEVQPLYGQITKPVLILWGCEDKWIPLEQGKVLRDMIPGSVLHLITDAGHLVIEEKPGRLVERILPFLQE